MNAQYAPVDKFIHWLAKGWKLPLIVQPCDVGGYSVIVWREADQ